MRLGVIGAGQIGAMLAAAWITAGIDAPVLVHTRTRAKAEALSAAHPGRVIVCDSAAAAARACDALFVCARAPDAEDIVAEIADQLRPEQYIALTNSTTPLAWLESRAPCRAAKIIPSLTQYAHAGILLVMSGARMEGDAAVAFYDLLAMIGQPYTIGEDAVRIYSDLTSCGPAFWAALAADMERAAEVRGVPAEAGRFLIGETLYGLGALLARREFTPQEVVRRVAAPGGVTHAGLSALRECAPHLFARVFAATAAHQYSGQAQFPADGDRDAGSAPF